VDFDLYVHDQNGNLITYDESLDADALCQLTPRWDGPFLMSVRSAAGLASYTISVQN
jgi:hypothetical protein